MIKIELANKRNSDGCAKAAERGVILGRLLCELYTVIETAMLADPLEVAQLKANFGKSKSRHSLDAEFDPTHIGKRKVLAKMYGTITSHGITNLKEKSILALKNMAEKFQALPIEYVRTIHLLKLTYEQMRRFPDIIVETCQNNVIFRQLVGLE